MLKKLLLFLLSVTFLIPFYPPMQSYAATTQNDDYQTEIAEIFPNMEGILPIVKVIAFKKIKGGTVAPLNMGIGLILSKDGLVMSESTLDDILLLDSPLDAYDGVNESSPDAYSICFIKSENPGNYDCSGTASRIGSNNEQGFELLEINSEDINGKDLSFLNYFNYKNENPVEINDPLKILGFKYGIESPIEFYDAQYLGLSDKNYYKFSYSDQDNANFYSNSIGIDKNGELFGLYSSYQGWVDYYPEYKTLYPISVVSESIDELKDNEINVDLEAQDYLIKYLQKFNLINELNKIETNNLFVSFPDTWEALPNIGVNIENYAADVSFLFEEKDGIKLIPVQSDAGYDQDTYVYIYEKEFPYEVTKEEIENINNVKQILFNDLYSETVIPSNLEEISLNNKYSGYKSVFSPINKDFSTTDYTNYYILNENILIGIIISSVDESGYENEIEEILNSVSIESGSSSQENSITNENPYFLIENNSSDSGWYFYTPNWQHIFNIAFFPISEDIMDIEMIRPNDLYNHISFIYEPYFQKNSPTNNEGVEMTPEEFLESYSSKYSWYTLLNNGKITIDGQEGVYNMYSDYTSSLEIVDRKKELTVISILLLDQKEEGIFKFDLSVEKDKYEEFLPDFQNILSRIRLTNLETPGGYILPEFASLFSDLSDYKYIKQILELANSGIVQGYEDGAFKPDNKINRAEFLKIIIEGLNSEQKQDFQSFINNEYSQEEFSSTYKDITPDQWYSKYIFYATKRGIVQGYPDGYFYPNKEISFTEALKMMYLANKTEIKTPDNLSQDEWYLPYVDKAYRDGIVPDEITSYTHALTRGEMCYILAELFDKPPVYDF